MASAAKLGGIRIQDGEIVTEGCIPDAALQTPPGAPGAHAATHAAAGGDPLTLTQAQITGLVADLADKLNETEVQALIDAAIATVLNSAPGALDTLDELAAALGDDANFSATVTNALALKAPTANPTFTGTVTVPDNSFAIAKVSGLQTALDAKAPLASPALTGTPTAPTAAPGTNTTQLATTAFVQAATGGGGLTVLKKTSTQIINGTAFQDVTDLTFPVVNGTLYYFSFYVVLRAVGATTTGWRMSVNCPAGALDYMRQYQTVANSDLVGVATWLEGHAVSRDSMTVLTSSIAQDVDLVCRIEGTYNCTEDGTFALRAASESANNVIVIQRGICQYA